MYMVHCDGCYKTNCVLNGTSKIRLVTQVEKMFGRTGATCNANIGVLGMLRFCGHN